MKKLEKSVPIIRFKGFYEAWEQRKLEELAAFSKGSGYTKNDLVEKGMPLVLYGRLYTKYEIIITEVNTFTKMKDKSVISKGNEVVVPSSGETAKDISRASVIGAEGFILGGDLNIIKPKRELNSIFLALTISNGEQQKEIIKRAQGKSVVHVYNTDLKQVKLSYPTFNEQEKIGSFFRQLDNAIALHQRKLDALKLMKKGFLQQIFPNNEEKVPRVRFVNFDGEWEQRELGEEFEKVNERNDGSFGRNHWISVAKMYFVEPNKVLSNNIDTRTYVMRKGDIAFEGHPNATFKFGRFVANDIGSGIISELFPVYRHKSNYDNYYWKNAIQLEHIMSPIYSKSITSSGNSSNKLDSKHFLSQKIYIANFGEQEKIGSLFKQLDDTIILYQNKLNKFDILKKAYLQTMFI
ncbi:restriction endonuclease subunit S [Listeria monocytogenes]|nr:restriction endonuclease subunit S [Listeria monocytogenes]ECC0303654.1 restriction endonuclease subunit S [Listeria monocytogenes]EDH0873589.1 restriction endonuclease subunit S [Listeria monocytogenes]EDH0897622.1 restriction endonuclease subunit S [Listeria monocytogenes]EDH0943139.1 restriction endonuclease subunit S [Listeria monocytogenes]